MPYIPEIHHRHSVRLQGYDYTTAGAYFVTFCTHKRECLLGEIVEGKFNASSTGEIFCAIWERVPDHYPTVSMDAFVLMPNHMHGIILITDQQSGGQTPPLRQPALGQIIGFLKYQSTKHVNQFRNTPGIPVWQRNYYERVLRNEEELRLARQYIEENPLKWELDKENPKNIR